MNNAPRSEFHDNEYVNNVEERRVLGKKIARVDLSLSKVESWRGTFRLSVVCDIPFGDAASIRLVVSPFPAPSWSHAACRFPALRAPVHFLSRFMGPIMLESLSIMLISSGFDNLYINPVSRIAISYSTSSNQSLDAFDSSSNADEPSFRPSRGYT